MSDAYERAKGGRLTFKGGLLATRSKDIDKKKKKKKSKDVNSSLNEENIEFPEDPIQPSAAGDIYTIDAAKKMKYDELFPVEAKKFGYDPNAKSKAVEDALDDRVKKKADRYCK